MCPDVGIEPALQPLDSEPLCQHATANWVDVVAGVRIGSVPFLAL